MNQFKVGDKVIVKEGCKQKCLVLGNTDFDYLKIIEIYEGRYIYRGYLRDKEVGSCSHCYNDNHLEPYTPTITWETLKWKDVVLDEDGDKQMVLGVSNDLVFLSCINNFETSGNSRHKKELQNYGFTIKQAPVEKPKETIEVGEHTYKLVK